MAETEESSGYDVLAKFAALLAGLSFAALLELSGRPLRGELSWAFDGFLISAMLNTYGAVSWFGYNRDTGTPLPSVVIAWTGGFGMFLCGTGYLVASVSHRSILIVAGVFTILAFFWFRNLIPALLALRNAEKGKSKEPPKG